jgi:hypothetical protein
VHQKKKNNKESETCTSCDTRWTIQVTTHAYVTADKVTARRLKGIRFYNKIFKSTWKASTDMKLSGIAMINFDYTHGFSENFSQAYYQ